MAFAREFHNLVSLPDGNVLAVGGSSSGGGADPSKAVLPAEIWNPNTETWTTVASLQTPRMYHSTSLLLPDGRVLVAGGGRFAGAPRLSQRRDLLAAVPLQGPEADDLGGALGSLLRLARST